MPCSAQSDSGKEGGKLLIATEAENSLTTHVKCGWLLEGAGLGRIAISPDLPKTIRETQCQLEKRYQLHEQKAVVLQLSSAGLSTVTSRQPIFR